MRKILSIWNPLKGLKGQSQIILKDQTGHKDHRQMLVDRLRKSKVIKIMLISLKKGLKVRGTLQKQTL